MRSTIWNVHKFGGTSLASAERYKSAVKCIINSLEENDHIGGKIAVVVSAMGALEGVEKITSMLFKSATMASNRDPGYSEIIECIHRRHLDLASELLENEQLDEYIEFLNQDITDIGHLLKAIWLSKSSNNGDWWTGYGEIWSARLFTSLITSTSSKYTMKFLDARDVLTVSSSDNTPNLSKSGALLSSWLDSNECNGMVVTGYIASSEDGSPTTLGRDGSDYSASILASLLNAQSLTVWTDVDGIYSANPVSVPSAVVRPILSYSEAMELAYFGAKVLHPKTMSPVIASEIPVYIRNALNPTALGTCVNKTGSDGKEFLVKGLSCIPSLALLNVEGSGMIGVPGVSRRLFQAVQYSDCSVVLITQGGSEHSISFAVPLESADRAIEALVKEFRHELEIGYIQTIDSIQPCACLGIVGDQMVHTPGVAGQVFNALGMNGINLRAIAQGSSERNISCIIDEQDVDKALNVVHSALVNPLPSSLTLNVILSVSSFRDGWAFIKGSSFCINYLLLNETCIPLKEFSIEIGSEKSFFEHCESNRSAKLHELIVSNPCVLLDFDGNSSQMVSQLDVVELLSSNCNIVTDLCELVLPFGIDLISILKANHHQIIKCVLHSPRSENQDIFKSIFHLLDIEYESFSSEQDEYQLIIHRRSNSLLKFSFQHSRSDLIESFRQKLQTRSK